MSVCQNCGKGNTNEAVFCRFCGTKMSFQSPVVTHNPYGHSAPPQPYSWKTDEFRTQNEARPTRQIDQKPMTAPFGHPQYQPAALAHQQNQISPNFRCPNCMSQFTPRLERRISTGGWITFAVLLVVFFPLFWIGLLIKEDVHVCQSCNMRLN